MVGYDGAIMKPLKNLSGIGLLGAVVLMVLAASPVRAQHAGGQTGPAAAAKTVVDQADGTNGEATGDQSGEGETDSLLAFIDHVDFTRLWQDNTYVEWLILLGGIFGGLVIGRLVGYLLNKVGTRWDKRGWRVSGHLLMDLASPASLALLTAGLGVGLSYLVIDRAVQDFATKILYLLVTVAAFWYAYNLVSVVEVFLTDLTRRTESELDDQLVPLIRKSLRVFLVVVAVLFIAQNILGANVTSWLAGLGIIGLAVSLAAQDSLKNLFGSVTIFLDQPFLVGDFIKYAGETGTVEEIGFRSTKVRTLKGHVLTIPNSLIVNDPVENIGRRPYIRRVLNVTVTYDTPPEKVEAGVKIIREICQTEGIREAIHDPDEPDNPDRFPPRIYFNDFNAASLNIVVYYWHRPGAWWDYLAHSHKFDMELLRRFNEAGIDFAFPTQTLYLAGDENRQLTVNVQHHEGDGPRPPRR